MPTCLYLTVSRFTPMSPCLPPTVATYPVRYGHHVQSGACYVATRTDYVWTSPMTPEQLAIAALFGALQAGWAAIVKYLLDENGRIRTKLDEANKASADLIAIQNRMLKQVGLPIPKVDEKDHSP